MDYGNSNYKYCIGDESIPDTTTDDTSTDDETTTDAPLMKHQTKQQMMIILITYAIAKFADYGIYGSVVVVSGMYYNNFISFFVSFL